MALVVALSLWARLLPVLPMESEPKATVVAVVLLALAPRTLPQRVWPEPTPELSIVKVIVGSTVAVTRTDSTTAIRPEAVSASMTAPVESKWRTKKL